MLEKCGQKKETKNYYNWATVIFMVEQKGHLFFQELLELAVGIFDRNSELIIADQKLVDNRQKSNIHLTCSKNSRGN